MQNDQTEKLKLVGGFISLAVLFILGWWILSSIFNYVSGLDKALASTIIAGLFALFTLLFSYWKERTKTIQEAHREKKVEVYSIFFDMISDVVRNSNQNTESKNGDSNLDRFLQSTKFKDRMFELWRGVTFYGSPEVINTLNKWKTGTHNVDNPIDQVRAIGAILLAMRKDIGLSNTGITDLTIHQMYVSDDLRSVATSKGQK